MLLLVALALGAPPEPVRSIPVDPPIAPFHTVSLSVSEGTWMNVDVSPDGALVAFDLLGHIYVVPIAGGAATPLTSGHSWNMHPRFSPDGRRLAFTSDRAGGDNLWVMNVDGSEPHAVSEEPFRLLAQPDWTPDGRWVFGRKHFTDTRSLGTGEIWAFDAEGTSSGVGWTEKGHNEADVNEPAISPDGRYLYVSEAGPFEYSRNVYAGIYAITRVDLWTGERRTEVSGPGGAVRPQVSPDGRSLGYLRRDLGGQRDQWVVRELATGRERVVYDRLDRDQQETWSLHGTFPTWSWLPDGAGAVFSSGGALLRVGLDGKVTPIPFVAPVSRAVEEAVRQPHAVAPTEQQAKVIRWPQLGPDGQTWLLQALGRLWTQRDGEEAVPLTPADSLAFAPAWRPDGGAVAYVTWDDRRGGMLWVQRLQGLKPLGEPIQVGDTWDYYTNPAFSADGMRLVWVRGNGLISRGESAAGEGLLRVQWRDIGGEVHEAGEVSSRGGGVRPPRPVFSPDGARVWVTDAEGDATALISLSLDGYDRRVLARGRFAAEITPSPDGRYIAWKAQHRVYVAAWPPRGARPLELGEPGTAAPAVRLSSDLGEWTRWTGSTLTWSAGATLYRVDLAGGLPERPEAPELKASKKDPMPDGTLPALGTSIEARVPLVRPVHSRAVALVGATVLPMAGEAVIEDAVIVVRGERVVAVGKRGSVEIPADATKVDLTGRYVIPGLVDVHAHMGYGWADVAPGVIPAYAANLAYGVTTTHDPSADTSFVFSQRELVEAGRVVGPRIFSTGFILYGAENEDKAVVETLDDAREHLRRLARYGAFSVKSYNQPRRDQRRNILQAARELGMLVVPEGGSTLAHNLTMILDGHTGIEHAVPVEQLYADVVQLWAGNAGVHYTPTLLVGYGGVWGEHSFYQRFDVWTKPRLQRWTPPGVLESRGKRRPLMAPEEDWHHKRLAATAWRLSQAGVRVNLGAHGQLQGLGPHWEMWAMVDGGFPAIEALRAGTLHGARYLGMEADIGSIEPGKLADLVVLSQDPLLQIENTEAVVRVMKGGVLYDPDTLATVWPEQGPPLAAPWHEAAVGGPRVGWESLGCAHGPE
jgi:imidazolonepropionase-like amidohydrolase/Tol biopolymer transport system component